jgi:hypothetical protein
MPHWKEDKLKRGEAFVTSEKGNLMSPIIKSGQDHMIAPATFESVMVDDIVFCKVKGNYYTHFVKGKNDVKGCLIGNNKGNMNGWTKQIFGKVIEILK